MTFLTEAIISHETAAQRRLGDLYAWHQVVWTAFPNRDGQKRDFLTRLDAGNEGFRLLIVSPEMPKRPDWCLEPCWRTKQIPDTYFSMRRYAFQLRANPTRKVTKLDPDGKPTKNGRRVPLREREEYIRWIERKGDQGGFSMETGSLRTIQRGREHFHKKGLRGTHTAVDFEGFLRVTDPERFSQSFSRGIGPAKAFGFGLLVIAPVPDSA